MGYLERFICSRWFFWATVALFVFEATWLIFVNRYPMAFDEGFHFLFIQFFSHHLNPLVTHQTGYYKLGAIPHNPSILYHYLMSFPYRLIVLFSGSVKVQVIALRLINLIFAVTSLIFASKILKQLHLPTSVNNLCIFVFALTPIYPVLTAQLNYDNLLIPTVFICIYLTIDVIKQITKGALKAKTLLLLADICFFGSFVKFSFLPIFLGIVLTITIYFCQFNGRHIKQALSELAKSYSSIRVGAKLALSLIFIAGTLLFINFYGYNLVEYRNLTAQCQQVLTPSECSNYGPWVRNNNARQYAIAHPTIHHMAPAHFTVYWFKVMYYQLFGEVIPTGGLVYIVKEFYAYIIFMSVFAGLCAIAELKKIIGGHKYIIPIGIICVVYLFSLWLRNYTNYLQLGKPLAIQGRYLVPVLLYLYALMALGVYYFFQRQKYRKFHVRSAIVVITIFFFIYFGGFVRYVNAISPKFGWVENATSKKEISH